MKFKLLYEKWSEPVTVSDLIEELQSLPMEAIVSFEPPYDDNLHYYIQGYWLGKTTDLDVDSDEEPIDSTYNKSIVIFTS